MKNSIVWLISLSAAGLLFSGYLSAVKLFTNTCALGESCPLFLGLPACWYGFALYLVLFIASVAALSAVRKGEFRRARTGVTVVFDTAFLGIIFAGSFVVGEIRVWLDTGIWIRYTLGLPSCAYGLIFYVAIAAISFVVWRKLR